MPHPNIVQPFLKWPGGKRWLVTNHPHAFPKRIKRLIEPFLGSGCVFFKLAPKRALLGDINPDLIAAYQGLKFYAHEVEEKLQTHFDEHDDFHYYSVRDSRPRSLISRAARFIYLNRTCFNGIFRVNQHGMFNVPKGNRDTVIFDADDFEAISAVLQKVSLYACDFEILVNKAESGDFIFADPPYTVHHNLNGFVKYNETLFSWADQVRLSKALKGAADRGAQILCTNADHQTIRDLYEPRGFLCQTVSRFSPISAEASHRRLFSELLITAP